MNLVYVNELGPNYKGDNIYEFILGIDLHLIQESDFFGVYDAIDGVISLAWENEDSDSIINDKLKRLVFSYGESVKSVEDKLYERDIVLSYEKSFIEHEQ